MSTRGPSGRGVPSASHAPHSTRAPESRVSQNRRTSVLLPMPASPETSTSLPPPDGDVVEALLQRFQERRALEQTALGTRVFGDRTHGGHRATPDERNQARLGEAGASVRARPLTRRAPGGRNWSREASSQPNACTRGSMLAYRPSGFGYQIQTCIVTSAGCQKLNDAPDCGLVCGQASVLGSGTKVPSL